MFTVLRFAVNCVVELSSTIREKRIHQHIIFSHSPTTIIEEQQWTQNKTKRRWIMIIVQRKCRII